MPIFLNDEKVDKLIDYLSRYMFFEKQKISCLNALSERKFAICEHGHRIQITNENIDKLKIGNLCITKLPNGLDCKAKIIRIHTREKDEDLDDLINFFEYKKSKYIEKAYELIKNHPVVTRWLTFIKGLGPTSIVKIIRFLETHRSLEEFTPPKLFARVGAEIVAVCEKCGYVLKGVPVFSKKNPIKCPKCGESMKPHIPYKAINKEVRYSPLARHLIRSSIVTLIITNWKLFKQEKDVSNYFKIWIVKTYEKFNKYVSDENEIQAIIDATKASIFSLVKLFLGHLWEVVIRIKRIEDDISNYLKFLKQHKHTYIPPLVDNIQYREVFYKIVLNKENTYDEIYEKIDNEYQKVIKETKFIELLDNVVI